MAGAVRTGVRTGIIAGIAGVLTLSGIAPPTLATPPTPTPTATSGAGTPARIVSVDHCADQYVLALAERGDIAALSPRATDSYSYHAERAEGLPQRPPTAENLLMLDPGVVVRLWGGSRGTKTTLARYDIPVVQVDYGTDIATARRNLRRVGEALGAEGKAADLITSMNERLEQARSRRLPPDRRPRAAYVTPRGTTAGEGTFVDALLTAAGLRNVAAEAGRGGWHPVDLERLALNPPDIVVGGFFDRTERPDYWSIARHSFLEDLFDRVPFVRIPGRFLTCQAWYFLDAVELLQAHMAERRGMLRAPQKPGVPPPPAGTGADLTTGGPPDSRVAQGAP